jgi:DNA-binding transcriptional ArsR family regulator
VAVASGGKFMEKQVTQGKVLYIAFEDPAKRLKSRNLLMSTPRDTPVTFKTDYRLLNEGGLDDLYLDVEAEDYKLVIIDTFGRSIGLIEVRDYSENVMALSPLQKLAQRKGLTMLLVDHHSKLGASNPILDLIGSIGKAGTFDTLMGLYRERDKAGAKLIIIGRDQEDTDLAIEWDGLLHCWQSMGDTQSVFKNEVLATMRVLKQIGELATTTAIAEHMDASPGNVSRAISDLVGAGLARRLAKDGRKQPYEAI